MLYKMNGKFQVSIPEMSYEYLVYVVVLQLQIKEVCIDRAPSFEHLNHAH